MTEHVSPPDNRNVLPFVQPRPQAPPLPPASVETEAALIGCIFTQPHVYPLIQHLVTADHFHEPVHAEIWQVIVAIAEAGDTPDLLKVKAAVGPKLLTYDLGGASVAQYLVRLAADGCVPVSAEEYARTIQQYWQLRALAQATIDVREGGSFVPGPTLERIYTEVDRIRATFVTRRSTSATFDQAGEELVASLTQDLQGGGPRLPASGIPALDREIGGAPQPSNLILVAARTSMGKSILGTEVARAMAAQGHAAIYHSLEMSRRQISARIASSTLLDRHFELPFGRILQPGGLTQAQAQVVADIIADLRGSPLRIEDGGGRSMVEIAAASDRLANHYARKGKKLGCVVIDHAHIVRPARVYPREDQGYKEIADGALALAKHLDCPVFLLAQCNRQTEGREDKRPQLSDIRGAGAFEENADTVCFLYRPAYYIERSKDFREGEAEAQEDFNRSKHLLEIIIDKNRAGMPNQTVRAWIDPGFNAIREFQFS